jgi:AraC family transcriptional regulator
MGLAPHQYVIARRLELAKRLLLTTRLNVAEIAWSIGYENISHFRRLFTGHIGVTPGEIRRATGIQQRA